MGRQERQPEPQFTRRGFFRNTVRGAAAAGAAAIGGFLAGRSSADETVWQIDPYKCIACDKCMDHCVVKPSAVKCVHGYAQCGYCRLCTGYFTPDAPQLNEGAENQLCPTDAIRRTFIEDPYYQYSIDEELCIGCAKCVDGCTTFGNGSMFLQIRHDRCVNCNDCAIARVCPADAIRRVPADEPYLPKVIEPDGEGDA